MKADREIMLSNDKRVYLRKPTKEDAQKMIDYLNRIGGESDFLLFGKNEIQISATQEEHIIEDMNLLHNSIMLVGESEGQIVSISQIRSPVVERIRHVGELAISVRKDYWGLGIGSAIMEMLIEFAKETQVIKVISLKVNAQNESAIHLYEKFGFQEIGVFEKFFYIHEQYYNAVMMNYYL